MRGAPTLNLDLDSPRVILRSGGTTEADGAPAMLTGRVMLKLTERASIKDIWVQFSGRSKLCYSEGPPNFKNYSLDNPIWNGFQNFMPERANGKDHTHTLNAGLHQFNFEFIVPPDLPPTMRSYSGSATVEYRLKAVVARSGFASSNLTCKRSIPLHRGLGSEAIEFNSTVEIDNTWPNKVMYSFTLPHKAHAAGDDLPISVHFVPLGKGIRVKEITTEIRENLIIYGKHGYQHNESHAIFIDKEDCDPNENSINRIQSQPTSAPLSRVASLAQLGDLQLSMSGSHSPSVTHSPSVPSPQPSVSSGVAPHDLSSRLAKIKVRGDERTPPYNGNSGGQPTQTSSGYLSPRSRSGTGSRNDPQSQFVQRVQEALEPEPAFEPLDDQDLPPSEKHMVFHVRIPKFAAPSNAMSPAVISHRIRWTCLIENQDGHTSELRCALPIMILDPFFSDEVQLATSGARNLLFGPSGCLVEQNEDTLNSDLPAYESHIQDRIANYHVPTAPVSYQLNPWASANNTPFQTPFPSRPPSPSSLPRSSEDAESSEAYNPYFPRSTDQTFSAHDVSQRLLTGHRSGGQSRAETPSSAVPSTSQQPFAADLATTPTVPGLSSSSNSQQGSSGPSSVLSNSGGGHSLFNLHLPKSKSRRPFGGRHSSASPSTSGLATLGSREDPGQAPINPLSMPTTPMNMPQTAPTSPTRHDISLGANHQGPLSLPANPNLDNGEGPDFTNVPPYNVARDWLGGGVVPLSSMIGLPTYEESNSVPPSRVGSPTSQAPPPSTSQTSS